MASDHESSIVVMPSIIQGGQSEGLGITSHLAAFPWEHPMPELSPHSPKKASIKVAVEADKTHYWCACGKSANQPMCDGTHKLF